MVLNILCTGNYLHLSGSIDKVGASVPGVNRFTLAQGYTRWYNCSEQQPENSVFNTFVIMLATTSLISVHFLHSSSSRSIAFGSSSFSESPFISIELGSGTAIGREPSILNGIVKPLLQCCSPSMLRNESVCVFPC